MARSSPGCASAISGRGTGLNPGPEWMSSRGANRGWKLGCAAGADGSSGSLKPNVLSVWRAKGGRDRLNTTRS